MIDGSQAAGVCRERMKKRFRDLSAAAVCSSAFLSRNHSSPPPLSLSVHFCLGCVREVMMDGRIRMNDARLTLPWPLHLTCEISQLCSVGKLDCHLAQEIPKEEYVVDMWV